MFTASAIGPTARGERDLIGVWGRNGRADGLDRVVIPAVGAVIQSRRYAISRSRSRLVDIWRPA